MAACRIVKELQKRTKIDAMQVVVVTSSYFYSVFRQSGGFQCIVFSLGGFIELYQV